MKQYFANLIELALVAFLASGCVACSKEPAGVVTDTSEEPSVDVSEEPVDTRIAYADLYDASVDPVQFFYPMPSVAPESHYIIAEANRSDRNSLRQPQYGLQYHLLAHSLCGLAGIALEEGRTNTALWLEVDGNGYKKAREALGTELGKVSAFDLALDPDGKYGVRELVDGYVLTDVENNPESNEVATVAAHVYNSIIVDVRDKAKFDAAGYSMTYDARTKSTADAWHEFRDKCSGAALVVMPVQTGELREYAIRNRLFCFNLNKAYNTTASGQNNALFDEVLSWLDPNAPVLGWEAGVGGEDVFVGKVSRYGKLMLAADWSYNLSLTSIGYASRQAGSLSRVVNPLNIDYDRHRNYVSFFLSDGDNYQWVMGDGFVNGYYNLLESNNAAKMSFGLCSQALSQLSPSRLDYLYGYQRASGTLMETFGGGYFYVDTYSTATGRRSEDLAVIAARTAAHMRSHRLKVLHLIAKDVNSTAASEAYEAFIKANDQLEGIVVIQYDPYTGGHGQVKWFTNTAGYDIPVVFTKYQLWKDNTNARNGSGSPAEVARFIEAGETEKDSWSPVVVHAWSNFDGRKSADAAAACLAACPANVEAVNIQELIWRIRMADRPEQTKKFLETIK